MKEKLKQILARFVFSLYHKKILKNRISVNSIEETVEHLVKSEDSLVRFGDGEIKLMAGKEIPFQKPDPALAERLKDILQTEEAGLSVALPDIFEDVSAYVEKSQSFWMEHLLFHRREYNRYCCVRAVRADVRRHTPRVLRTAEPLRPRLRRRARSGECEACAGDT